MKHADTIAIFIVLLLFVIARIFLQKGTWHRGFVIAFEAVGVFLNQIRISNNNQVKVAWDINLRAFSLLATTALSAIIFKNLIAASRDEINTIDHLVKSNLTIYAPDYLKQQEIWGYMRYSSYYSCMPLFNLLRLQFPGQVFDQKLYLQQQMKYKKDW